MVRLRVLDILKERNLTKYWLFKRLEMTYTAYNKMITNQTTSIHFDTLDRLSSILDCPVGDLFEKFEDDVTKEK